MQSSISNQRLMLYTASRASSDTTSTGHYIINLRFRSVLKACVPHDWRMAQELMSFYRRLRNAKL